MSISKLQCLLWYGLRPVNVHDRQATGHRGRFRWTRGCLVQGQLPWRDELPRLHKVPVGTSRMLAYVRYLYRVSAALRGKGRNKQNVSGNRGCAERGVSEWRTEKSCALRYSIAAVVMSALQACFARYRGDWQSRNQRGLGLQRAHCLHAIEAGISLLLPRRQSRVAAPDVRELPSRWHGRDCVPPTPVCRGTIPLVSSHKPAALLAPPASGRPEVGAGGERASQGKSFL